MPNKTNLENEIWHTYRGGTGLMTECLAM